MARVDVGGRAIATPPDGFLLVEKPVKLTSHDVVQAVRRRLGIRRVGHTGTLDPLARGLLVLLVGRATKHQQTLQACEKIYEGALRLGTQTDTGDAMGAVVRTAAVPPFTASRAAEILRSFEGPLSQTPPAYSAVKVRGHPAYWWARRRQPVTLSPRVVHVAELALLDCAPQTIAFRIRCSAGTYVRTLAESIAERLGTVGHLSDLVRLRVGPFRLDDARPLSWIAQAPLEALHAEIRPVPVRGRGLEAR